MRRCLPAAALLLVVLASAAAPSKTYNSPTIDGHVTTDPGDWEADEWAVDDPDFDCRYVPNDPDLDDLYVTWDADSLYVGVKTSRAPGGFGNGYLLFIDTDAQSGITGATDFTASAYYPRRITFSGVGVDVIVAGWDLPPVFDVKHIADIQNPADVEGVHTVGQNTPEIRHIEAALSWNGLFGLGEGVVPAGTTLRFVAAIVGGDNSGAYDAMPTTSTGIESNPATPWDAYIDLDEHYEAVVDANLDGAPDTGYPPGGSISGTVTLDEPGDTETVVTLTAYLAGAPVKSGTTPPGGGDYTIPLLPDGEYVVEATALGYLPESETVMIVDEAEVAGVDFTMTGVDGAIEGEVVLSGGPAVDVTVTAYEADTGEVAGDGAQVVPGGSGEFRIALVLDGTYRVEAEAKGYVEQDTTAAVIDEGVADVGLMTLPAVEATRYVFLNSAGSRIYGVGTTVSLPLVGIYYYANAWIEPRDDDDRVALWDYAAQDSIRLSATKLDPIYQAEGTVTYARLDETELADAMIRSDMFEEGRAGFAAACDSVQVLRVLAARGAVDGILEVGIDVPAPTRLRLSSSVQTIPTVTGVAEITGRLLDASGNDARVEGLPVSMVALGVGGQLDPSAVETDANGHLDEVIEFSGSAAGTARVTAVIAPGSEYANIAVDTIAIVLEPGDPALVELSVAPPALRPGDRATVTAHVVDEPGNPVGLEGLSIELSAYPPGLLTSLQSPVVTDSTGRATADLEAGPHYGIVEISGSAPGVSVQTVFVAIDATIVAVDEQAPESDEEHNSLDGVDLTIMRAKNDEEELTVTLDFSSDWSGIQLGLAIEARGDAAGATPDPFGMPVVYGHDLLPDYAFTYKYSEGSYADLRRWWEGAWQWYDSINEIWIAEWDNGADLFAAGWIVTDDEHVSFRVPLSAIEATLGDTVRLEAYTTQEEGEKRTALDSVPHDATHDMIPEVGEWWETATAPVTLSYYAGYTLREEGLAPELSDGEAVVLNGRARADTAKAGDRVAYSIRATDTGGGIGDVFIDLSELGGLEFTRMLDDGEKGDGAARDGVYTATDSVRTSAANGPHTVLVTARDAENVAEATSRIDIIVDNPAAALRSFVDRDGDPVTGFGDDHGPNRPGEEGLYYEYPSNNVFLDGSFDIGRVEIFPDGGWLVFRTYIDDLVNHEDPTSADWGAPNPSEFTCNDPYMTDLNLQKIDIYIDTREGEGATSGFPNRFVDVAPVDAWEYGIAIEGWGKWFVVSNGLNSTASWSLHKTDGDIRICDNYVEDFIDVRIDRSLFGQDLDDANDNVANWDIIVCTSSHDGDSNDQNLGAIRWVNAATTEWQIGGGSDGEAGRERDPNIMDIAADHGKDHRRGRPQNDMLNYKTAEARRRFAENKVACVIEASYALDLAPPVIGEFIYDERVELERDSTGVQHIRWLALDGAPVVIWTTITDVTGVGAARLIWQPDGNPALRDSVEMVNIVGDIWAGDIHPDDLVSGTNITDLEVTGDARVIAVSAFAVDSAPAANSARTGPRVLAIPEPRPAFQRKEDLDELVSAGAEAHIVFQDGTIITIEEADVDTVPEGVDVVLTPVPQSGIDLANVRDDMDFVGVARRIAIDVGGSGPLEFIGPPTLTLHYPQYDVGGLDERKFGIFGWVEETGRWIYQGSAARPGSNALAVDTEKEGLFGIFHWEALDFGDSRGLAGVLAEPNPFSPNGDGLYDKTTISFHLGREADHVNIEFYDLGGRLARRIVFKDPTEYTGRPQLSREWDGTDDNGHVVPYGIYIMRVEAKFKTEPTYERVNIPVVVIK